MPACMKYYLLVPVLTLVGIVVSCVIPVEGLVEAAFPYLLAGTYLSVATIMANLIMIPTCFIISRTVKGLKNRNASMNEFKEKLQKELNLSKLKDDNNNLELLEDTKKTDNYQNDTLYNVQISQNNNVELQQKYNGHSLVKKLIPQDNNKKK